MFRFYLCFWVQIYYKTANTMFVQLSKPDKFHKIESPQGLYYINMV